MRWLRVFLLACLLFNGLKGWLQRIGLGRLPGNFSLRLGGREWYLPLTSSLFLDAPRRPPLCGVRPLNGEQGNLGRPGVSLGLLEMLIGAVV